MSITASVIIKDSPSVLVDFLRDPFHLRLWTIHKNLYNHQGLCKEFREVSGGASFSIIRTQVNCMDCEPTQVIYTWSDMDHNPYKQFSFSITEQATNQTLISIQLPDATKLKLIQLELEILKEFLETNKLKQLTEDEIIFLQKQQALLAL